METIYRIYGAYQWKETGESNAKNEKPIIAIKALITQVQKRLASTLPELKINIGYNRLRATAGAFLLDGITDRIRNSDAIIFDISDFNPNVMFELGIAIEASRNQRGAKVFIICEGKDISSVKVPSDLSGYFISFYEIKDNKATYHDNNSLAMRLLSEISEKTNKAYIEDEV
jgi:hypothetical protein